MLHLPTAKIYANNFEFMFDETPHETQAAREERILQFWKEAHIFKKSLDKNASHTLFSFYDGPPFATGLPHYGHLLAGTLKDVVPRYKTMKGYFVPRAFGWDCHGLPVEQEIEKLCNLTRSHNIEEFGIARFNDECRKIVQRYTHEWKTTVERMGRWVDFDKTWKTMDLSFMESVWWIFQQLYQKGLVYRGFKVMPFSAKLGTPLSNFEASENYKEVDDPALTVAFRLKERPHAHLLAWTTTPWTLISNLALVVGPEIAYVEVQDRSSGKHYILAKARLPFVFPDPESYGHVRDWTAAELEGMAYQPLFSHFADCADQGAFRVIVDGFVATEDGTGIVHAAPAFGESDFYACRKYSLPLVCPVDKHGCFTAPVTEYTGKFVKDADKAIIAALKKQGLVLHHASIRHRYPFCYRSDTPLIYRAIDTWFIAVEQIKPQLLQANASIHWTPSHLKEGRFGKWLEGARDWAISRNRFWGTPIPIWESEDGERIVVGSLQELRDLTGYEAQDLHREFVDPLVIEKEGKIFRRVPEVFDCWFESGSMPYAQHHYPFENRTLFKKGFPADFIAEGLDQTRAWFYVLTVLSVALFEKPAFKNVVVNGIVLAEDGAKMSKRLKNYPPPSDVLDTFGADALRLYLLHSPAVKAEDLRFSARGVELVSRQFLLPLWNAYSFLATYARIYGWQPLKSFKKPSALIDRWLLSLLQELIVSVEKGMDSYDLSLAVEPFVGFVDQLTNWYIRRCRPRFWADEDTPDRQQAFETLYHSLLVLCKVAAPFIPFLSEAIYQQLRSPDMPESVHLCSYPERDGNMEDGRLQQSMQIVQEIVSSGHALRKEHKLKVRQPLPKLFLCTSNAQVRSYLQKKDFLELIKEELNVKAIEVLEEEGGFVRLCAKPNFRLLGKKVGRHMPAVKAAIQRFTRLELEQLLKGEGVSVSVKEEIFSIDPEEVEVQRQVKEGVVAAATSNLTVALDTSLSEELLLEGLARELKNKLNTMRRENGLAVTDRIKVYLHTTPRVLQALEKWQDFVMQEALAVEIIMMTADGGTPWDLNGEPTSIRIQKIES